jgi:hypothetical protein
MFGGSAISKELFDSITKLVPEGGKLLEFGSGEGTKALIRLWNVISIEHNLKYVIHGHGHETIRAEIDPVTGWYHAERVKIALRKGPYDLILIDGPPAKARGNIQIDLFKDVNCPVIFDDVNRYIDRGAMKQFCSELGYSFQIIKGDQKDFAICQKDGNHTS